MITRNDIEQMASRIKAGLPCRVFVFGSYAWGRPNACSDVDLAVVLADDSVVKHPSRIASRPPSSQLSAETWRMTSG